MDGLSVVKLDIYFKLIPRLEILQKRSFIPNINNIHTVTRY